MNEDTIKPKEKELFSKYPNLFGYTNPEKIQRRMVGTIIDAFGIECGYGWFDIISELCDKINEYEKSKNTGSLLESFEKKYTPVKFTQIKQKFGGLTIYFDGGDKQIRNFVEEAERSSYTICEVCGKPGKPTKKGWIRVVCEEHEKNEK